MIIPRAVSWLRRFCTWGEWCVIAGLLLLMIAPACVRAQAPALSEVEVMVAQASRAFGRPVFDLPAVELVPRSALPPGWLAAYRLNVIWLRDDFRRDDLFWQSVLFHEVVHHVQEKLGRFGTRVHCLQIVARENEAYTLQSMWLTANGVGVLHFRRRVCA